MATVRTVGLGAFDSNAETWEQYTERLGYYFEANGIGDAAKKRAILLSEVGPKTVLVDIKPGQPGQTGRQSVHRHRHVVKTTLQPGTVGNCREVQVS